MLLQGIAEENTCRFGLGIEVSCLPDVIPGNPRYVLHLLKWVFLKQGLQLFKSHCPLGHKFVIEEAVIYDDLQ